MNLTELQWVYGIIIVINTNVYAQLDGHMYMERNLGWTIQYNNKES